jgi:hypothetical protein
MPYPAKPIWVRQVSPGRHQRRGAFYLIPAFLTLLAGLFTFNPAQAQAKMDAANLMSGSYINNPRNSGDALAKPEVSAVQKSGNEAASLAQPTRTPKPTSTPPVIPPPASPASTGLMILLATLVMAVILGGIWINRRRVF